MGWVLMSERELNRVEVLSQVSQGRMSATRRSMLTSTAPKDSPNNWRAIFPAVTKSGNRATPDAPEARYFRRIGPFINAQTM